jgi:hypothetical protein
MGIPRRPDWTEPMGTGFWGLGYRLRGNRGLVLLSNEATFVSDDPDRLWPFILTRDRRRNRRIERSVARQANVLPFLEHQSLGRDDVLCVREKHLGELLAVLEQRPIQSNGEE